jgi:hypothetical protein
LKLAEVERIRRTPGRSVLMFLTERCPVGCAHCSVDARSDSPTIRDFDRFEAVLAGVCATPELDIVGISGGEPFVERRGLRLAVDRLNHAGKRIVLYTSGVWAGPRIPEWISSVLRRTNCVFLSTDAFHADSIEDDRFVHAAQTVAAADVWIVVQVLAIPAMVQRAEHLVESAFGRDWSEHAELSFIAPLPYGRGASVFENQPASRAGSGFGACHALAAPVVRYDGVVSACCNERVIVGWGPERLRRAFSSDFDIHQVMSGLRADPLLRVIQGLGAGFVTEHPLFADLAQREFASICDLCWAVQSRAAESDTEADPLLHAMASLVDVRGPA